MKTKESGYTLIELLVAIAIMGILASIAVVNYQKVMTHAKATQIASHLHAIEDGVISAIIDGNTDKDFGGRTDSTNFNQSILKNYLTEANLSDVPNGIHLSVAPMPMGGAKPGQFFIWVQVRGDKGTEKILDQLEKMFPKTITHAGPTEFVVIDSDMLKVKEHL